MINITVYMCMIKHMHANDDLNYDSFDVFITPWVIGL